MKYFHIKSNNKAVYFTYNSLYSQIKYFYKIIKVRIVLEIDHSNDLEIRRLLKVSIARTKDDFKLAFELKTAEQSNALCDN